MLLPEGAPATRCGPRSREARIQTSVHYPPIHQFSLYAELGARRPLPRTEGVAGRLVTLPLYGHMGEEEVDAVVDTLVGALP